MISGHLRRLLSGPRAPVLGACLLAVAGLLLLWFTSGPKVDTQPLRVGIDNAPPYQILRPDGGVEGLSVDMIREAAERRGIPIVFVPLPGIHPEEALRSGKVDLWPAGGITKERRAWLHMTQPWLTNRYVLISLIGNVRDPPRTIALKPLPIIAASVPARFPNSKLLPQPDRVEALQLLCAGQVDSALVEARYLDQALLQRPRGCESAQLKVAFVDGVRLDLALISLPSAASATDALRAEIGRLAEDGHMAASLDRWSPLSSSETRSIYTLREAERRSRLFTYGSAAALAMVLLLGGQAWRMRRARHRELLLADKLSIEQERWRLAVAANNEGVFDWDATTGRTEFSPRWKEIIGIDASDTSDDEEFWTSRIHPDDRPRVLDGLQAYLQRRAKAYEVEYRMRHVDGSWRWVFAHAQAVWDEAGKPLRLVGSHSDITARKNAEHALEDSQQRLELALLAGALGMWDWNVTTGAAYYSPGYAKILGYEFSELEQHYTTFDRLMHPDDRMELGAVLTSRLSGAEDRFEAEFRMKHKDGQWRWILSHGQVVERERTGMAARIVGTHQDITARKNAEAALLQAKEDAEAGTRAKSEFLAVMSHEIRTPMNGVIGMTSLLLDTPLNAEQADYVETIRASANALLAIINDILDFSKIEAGRMELEQLDFDIQATVGQAVALVAETAQKKGLSVSIHIDPAVPEVVLGDPGRVRQVLLNYLSNAVKFTARGEIRVRVSREEQGGGEFLRFSVRDTGIGLNETEQGRIFTAFTQADSSTTRRFGGTGLGLAVCRRLTELMGGTVGVDSVPGEGSTFWFTMRLEVSRTPPKPVFSLPARREPKRRPVPLGPSSKLSAGYVLVAEDNTTNQKVARLLLERLGYRVDTVADGREAVEAVQSRPYDLVLMDCQMPELDGYGATRAIRAAERLSGHHTPIIALTANALQGEREKCLASGMDDYLSKPIHIEALVRVVSRWIGTPVAG